MDVAHPGRHVVDWVPAYRLITSGSLEAEWTGLVWMNAPFGKRNGLEPWLAKFVAHGNGIALTPDRTSAPWWQRFTPHMGAVLFVAPKIRFIPGAGAKSSSPAQGTCLMAIGHEAVAALRRASSLGLILVPQSQGEQR